jgi:serine/threonine-protein kinase
MSIYQSKDGAEERIETTLVGKYRIESIIQKGGMGTVFSGTHIELGKKIAIKILHPNCAASKEVVQRFLNEARGTAKLQHRNIVDILDIGTDERGIPFFVMEYLPGESLKERFVRREGRLSPQETADIMIQTLTGLYVAHARGIIHRDMKPGNIYIAKEADGSEVVKILDFGVAKFRELEIDELIELTSSGSILGTPSYMSPEQAAGKKSEIDYRTDIYSCGLVIYKALTGVNPFKGESHYETIQNIVNKPIPPLSRFMEDVPRGVEDVTLRATDKDKEKRFQDCREFIKALAVFYPGDESRLSDFSDRVPREISPSQVAEYEKSVVPNRAGPFLARSSTVIVSVFVLITLLILAAAGYRLVRKSRAGAEAREYPTTGQAVDASSRDQDAELPIPPVDVYVDIEFSGLPDGASIMVDGIQYSGNPIRLKKSDRPSSIVIVADGREILRQSFVPMQNEKIHIMTAEKEPAATKGKPGKKKKKDSDKEQPGNKTVDTDKSGGNIYKDFPG